MCRDLSYTLKNGVCGCNSRTEFEAGGICNAFIDCGDGFYNDGANNCLACKDNCTKCVNATHCTACS